MEILIVQILVLLFIMYIIFVLLYSMIKGAPYAPLGISRIKTMHKLLEPKKGELLADLGSGDGRIVKYFSENGTLSHGYEINPILYIISLFNLRKSKGKIYLGSYWNKDLSKYKYVTIYGVTYIMPSLEKKLLKELKPESRIVTNHFKFPTLKYDKKINDVYLYIVK